MTLHAARLLLRLTIALGVSLFLLSSSPTASAYPWMIRRDNPACYACHADPSGGGLLTAYGRVAGENWLAMQWDNVRYRSLLKKELRAQVTKSSADPAAQTEEAAGDEEAGAQDESMKLGRGTKFLWGAIPLPDSVLLGGDFRPAILSMSTAPSSAGGASTNGWKFYMMQADLEGQVSYGRLRANASIGYDGTGEAKLANITNWDPGSLSVGNLVSRVHWVGADLGANKEWLVRVGHMNVPFGIRSIEHELWIRQTTVTDTNQDQQDGLSIAYNGHGIRGEVMGVLGNLQVSPAQYRERGYVGYVERAIGSRFAVGVDSMILHADNDLFLNNSAAYRQAHGLFVRWSPVPLLYVSGEGAFVYCSTPQASTGGYVGTMQVDLEPITGVHLQGTAEMSNMPDGPATTTNDKPAFDYWGTVAWFFASHADLRLDLAYQTLPPAVTGGPGTGTTVAVAGLHLYL
jgi:hypothetical protein